MDIHHEANKTRGRYWTQINGGPKAELTYSRAGETLIILDHTGVPEAYRGRGMGAALVTRAVEDARSKGLKILPLCPFSAAQFRRHGDWADVLT